MREGGRLPALALVVITLAAGACAPLAASEEPREITVSATGRIAARPDTALVQLGAEAQAPALADATAEVARRMTAVVARLRALGLTDRDITTVAYAIDPLAAPRRSEADPPRIVAYRAVNVVQARIRRLEEAGRIVDAAVAAGANVVRRLAFTLDDPAAAEREARARAVRSAEARARELADAAGVRLGELVSLSEGGPAPRPVVERFGRAAVAAMEAPGPVEPGQLEVVISVEARYRIAR